MNHLLIAILTTAMTNSLTVTSPSFKNDDLIPSQFTCDGDNINPALSISDVPSDAQFLALIMDDPDAPNGTFDHWIMWNIPVSATISENSSPGVQGQNGRKENRYTGPCPPTGTHHYHFKVYALDKKLDLVPNSGKQQLESAMKGHILAEGELVGIYKTNK